MTSELTATDNCDVTNSQGREIQKHTDPAQTDFSTKKRLLGFYFHFKARNKFYLRLSWQITIELVQICHHVKASPICDSCLGRGELQLWAVSPKGQKRITALKNLVKSSRAEPCPKGEVCRSKFIITSSVAPLPAGLDTLGSSFFFFFWVGSVVVFLLLGLLVWFFFLQAPSLGSVPECISGFPFC